MSVESRDVYDITIIGGGPVGLFGAFYAGVRECKTKIIDSLSELGGQLTALYPEKYIFDMPGFPKVLAKDLVQVMADQGLWKDPTVCLEEQTRTVDYDDADGVYTLTTSKGVHYTKTIIIAAGIGALNPTRLSVDGAAALDGHGLHYVIRNLEDFRDKDVVIVGGGDTAIDWTLHVAPIAKSLRVVHRRDVFRAHEGSVKEAMAMPVDFLLWWVVEDVHGTDHLDAVTIRNTKTKETKTLDAQEVIVCIGFKSDIGPLKEWGLDLQKNSIVVDRHMETNRRGVFAAGDVAAYDGKLKLIATGVGEVCTAVNYAKNLIDPDSKLFPGHSSDMAIR
ncbi:MAG: NAD(P)/FAD-dependent oxidoreductase [Candidatus Poribacteria bacterium]